MELTFNKRTALAIMRALRAKNACGNFNRRRTNARPPDIFPAKRWTKGCLDRLESEMSVPYHLAGSTIEIAVPNRDDRIRSKAVRCTVYGNGIPQNSFVDIGNGASISSPELLFVETARLMHPLEHLMLGHELCGTFSRDAADPYNGPVTFDVPPLTSVRSIRRFLEATQYSRDHSRARESLSSLNDNAWSPTESLIAALLRLPIDNLGFDMGELVLNPRTSLEGELPGAKSSRVPDIMIAGTPVGINYDGLAHFDLKPIIEAAFELSAHPELSQTQAALSQATRRTRAKLLDDIRRNRELAAGGLTVIPVTKEDLYMPGGFDQIVALLIELVERQGKRDLSWQRKILQMKELGGERRRMMLSLLPGKHERNIQVARFIGGHAVYDGPRQVHECWIEL